MSKLICYINGRFLPLDEAALPVRDLAVLRGYGVFDFLRTYHGRPFRLRDHLRRLESSARLVCLDLPASLDEIEALVYQTLAQNDLEEANIRIVVTGGESDDAMTPAARPGLVILVNPPTLYPAAYYQQGIKVITYPTERYLPLAKTINYIPAIVALNRARAAGAHEALYVNHRGHILEGTTTNFFVFQGNRLITPGAEILPGVTRQFILDLARESFEVVEQPLTFEDLAQVDEAFISASNKEVMPVHQVDELRIGSGRPGPNTQRLMARFHEETYLTHSGS